MMRSVAEAAFSLFMFILSFGVILAGIMAVIPAWFAFMHGEPLRAVVYIVCGASVLFAGTFGACYSLGIRGK